MTCANAIASADLLCPDYRGFVQIKEIQNPAEPLFALLDVRIIEVAMYIDSNDLKLSIVMRKQSIAR